MYSPARHDTSAFDRPLAPQQPTARGRSTPAAARAGPLLWSATLLAWTTYAVYFAQLTSFPFQDYPNHITRAAILADLLFHGGQRFGGAFEVHFAISPYILHDAVLTLLIAAFGTVGGAAIFAVSVLLSLPCALIFYMRANAVPPRTQLFILLISLYLATDWFFLMGFMAFRLALAAIIVTLGLVDRLRRDWQPRVFGWYVITLVLGYLTHLTALVFFAPILAVTGVLRGWLRSTTLRREATLWLPVVALLSIHFGLIATAHHAGHAQAYNYYWGTVYDKLHHLNWEFDRFDGRPSPVMMYTLLACFSWVTWRHVCRAALLKPAVLEQLALAAAFFALYWIMPSTYRDSTFVDVRALCMVNLFLILAAVYLPPQEDAGRAFSTRPVLAIAFALACLNLSYLVLHMGRNNAWLVRYREVVAAIPPGTRVLPIYTQRSQRDIRPFLHAASYVTLDRAAIIPYLFSGDRGDLMTYFTYRQRPYMPAEDWYLSLEYWFQATPATYEVGGKPYTWRFHYDRVAQLWKTAELVPVDWNRVACEYDDLLVTLPFQEHYIEVPFRAIAFNETAALLAIDKQACHPGQTSTRKVRLPEER